MSNAMLERTKGWGEGKRRYRKVELPEQGGDRERKDLPRAVGCERQEFVKFRSPLSLSCTKSRCLAKARRSQWKKQKKMGNVSEVRRGVPGELGTVSMASRNCANQETCVWGRLGQGGGGECRNGWKVKGTKVSPAGGSEEKQVVREKTIKSVIVRRKTPYKSRRQGSPDR